MACGCQGMAVAGVTHHPGVPRGFSPRGCSPSAVFARCWAPATSIFIFFFSFFLSNQLCTGAFVYENILHKELTPTWQIETIGQLLVLPNLAGSL